VDRAEITVVIMSFVDVVIERASCVQSQVVHFCNIMLLCTVSGGQCISLSDGAICML